jgi:orotidine-5'-phosphate decarboxylase
MRIQEKLDAIVEANNSLVCVGLDTDPARVPDHLKGSPDAVFAFNKAIIDATRDLVCAYKPNTAFYEATGLDGLRQLEMTMRYIRETAPGVVTVLDAKRADIGSTNEGYVSFAYEWLGADSITLHPYLGKEALEPFLAREDKAAIILCHTSNPGAGEFQELHTEGEDLYMRVARAVAGSWNKRNNCMLVLGATYPEQLARVRHAVGDMTMLVPGIGAQGGDVEKTVRAGLNSRNAGIMINSTRAIIYASPGEDFADRAREETQTLRDEINRVRSS